MPREVLDEIEDMDADSSTAPEDVADSEVEQSTEAEATADSSAATDETEPAASLSIVRDVVGEREEQPEAAASSAEGEEGTGQGDDDQSPEPSDDYSDVPFNKHPRFQQLIHERNELRGQAGEYQKIVRFMDHHGLTNEEAANGVTIMGLAKVDPVAAFKAVAPWFKTLAIAAGEILPDDLAQRVQKGELTAPVAQELSRARAASAATAARQQFEQQRGERQQRSQSAQAVMTAAADWERDRSLKDPNFAAKLPRIQKEIAWLHATGQRPTTPEGVTKQLKTVYEAVNRELGQQAAAQTRQQKKPAITPVRGGAVAGNARPAAPSGKRSTVDLIHEIVGKRAS